MSHIKRETLPMADEFKQMDEARRAVGEHNDCAVKAVAAVTGAPYMEVLTLMNALGRRRGRGTPMHITREAVKRLGYSMTEIDEREFINKYPSPHHNLRGVTSHHPDRFNKVWADGNTYLFSSRKHILAVVNGRNVDWSRGRVLRCRWIWRVEKIESGF